MLWFNRFLVLNPLLLSTLASPVPTTRISPDAVLSKRAWNPEDLNNEFKGIYWNHLFEDADECTPEQIDKLVYATRYAIHLTQKPETDLEYSQAWNRYFVKYEHWAKSGVDYLEVAANIMRQYTS
jgi:hypothetical protein